MHRVIKPLPPRAANNPAGNTRKQALRAANAKWASCGSTRELSAVCLASRQPERPAPVAGSARPGQHLGACGSAGAPGSLMAPAKRPRGDQSGSNPAGGRGVQGEPASAAPRAPSAGRWSAGGDGDDAARPNPCPPGSCRGEGSFDRAPAADGLADDESDGAAAGTAVRTSLISCTPSTLSPTTMTAPTVTTIRIVRHQACLSMVTERINPMLASATSHPMCAYTRTPFDLALPPSGVNGQVRNGKDRQGFRPSQSFPFLFWGRAAGPDPASARPRRRPGHTLAASARVARLPGCELTRAARHSHGSAAKPWPVNL